MESVPPIDSPINWFLKWPLIQLKWMVYNNLARIHIYNWFISEI